MSDLTIQSYQGHTLVAYENSYGQTEIIGLWNVDASSLTESSFVFAFVQRRPASIGRKADTLL